ncbi:xanthine dehydrogenase family protein molybdopterin-binding subunit [Azospirillum sp. RWY-5-1]|uniref:Xanthine dehydrogenase family protein molybdopterin-binding subunit n=1 Tax=Azospirillum oleiclasticum TaxID=2735135 RepID=A0ABX2TGF2_9PROT|nr:molybdopterin cofactor-binding domain-containing protein [Azospirillum oleiclasticum]NYZ14404.1 xanthine dehydrogenase family protein molybdopterin-binding subunit [Azospirillum oleiclasticum]NYZ23244.1 xanthine dehydrogenase family protein molybdopterin-binding subunit [Azospirillum oleiclasticum]
MSGTIALDRRALLKGGVALGSGLLLAVPLSGPVLAAAGPAAATDLGAFLRIAADDTVTVIVPVVEMGQGAMTALAVVIVDELGADWSRVAVAPPPAGTAYQRPDVTKYQLTSGSWSVRLWYAPLRTAAAAARTMLVAAAAKEWGVDAASCATEAGRVLHRPSGRSIGFGAVAAAAARLPVPEKLVLKAAADLTLIGRSVPRVDVPSKVDGSGVYGIDVTVPGMVHAAIRHAPVYGGGVRSVDRASIAGEPGVLAVVEVPGAVVVVAESFWQAKAAAERLDVAFAPTPHDTAGTDALMAEERRKLDAPQAARFRSVGDAAAAIAGAARVVTADYSVPFIHHATLEPMNCTASVTADGCTLWVPTQCHTTALEAAVRLTGFDESRIRIHATLLGGGFGRRIHTDFIEPAILSSKAVGRPVKLLFTREEDMQHGFHRPAMTARLTASLDAGGGMTGLSMRVVGPSVHEHFWPAFFKDGLDYAAVMGLTTKATSSGLHYRIPAQHVDYIYQPTHVPIGYWRSVGASHNGFFMETFIDEVAHAAGADPYRFRRALLQDSPRGLAVLDKAAELAGWGKPLPPGHARGIAFCENVDSIVAEVAEVSVVEGRLRVHRVAAAIDCGTVINPDTVVMQMQGGIVNALSAVLGEEITVEDGRCVQSNFHDYPVLRLADAPVVDVHILRSDGPIGGVGEAMVPTLAPAVGNAIFAATGQRLRTQPFARDGLTVG